MGPRYTPVVAEATGTFLGTHLVEGRIYDLYYVPSGGVQPTLSARFSDQDSDYLSGLPFGWGPDQRGPLFLARALAEARGLDCQREKYLNRLVQHRGMLVPVDMVGEVDALLGHPSATATDLASA